MLSPNNISGIKKSRAKDTLTMGRNLCSDPNLKEEELCKVLNPPRQQVQPPVYPRYLFGGRKSRKNRRKTNKNKKTSRRNKSSKR